MAIPTLLLSPDESRDRNGPVTPTVGSGVITVPGQYGDAWKNDGPNAWSGAVLVSPYDVEDEYSILMRFKVLPLEEVTYFRTAVGSGWVSGFDVVHDRAAGRTRAQVGSVFARVLNEGEYGWIGITVSGLNMSVYGPNSQVLRRTLSAPAVFSGIRLAPSEGSEVESFLIFPVALADAEVQRIGMMDEAWTWENLLPRIGGVRTVHDPAPFAVRSIHGEI